VVKRSDKQAQSPLANFVPTIFIVYIQLVIIFLHFKAGNGLSLDSDSSPTGSGQLLE
jgi:hypothetical protein